jgi:hypothetical protein
MFLNKTKTISMSLLGLLISLLLQVTVVFAAEISAENTTPANQAPAATSQSITPASNVPAHSTGFKYTLLETFPGFFAAGSAQADLPAMILAIYKFGIWTVGIAGLFMLVIGGFMYMTSAGNNANAETAKKIIADSILGIVAALAAYLIMYVINPDLTKINFSNLTAAALVTESPETSAESAGTLQAGTAGSCAGLATQTGISSQCSEASSQLSNMLSCIAGKLPSAVITSISDSKGYLNCTPGNWTSSCAHSKYSCHYGGKTCTNGKSYAVDISTRNLSASQIISAANSCGASYTKDESGSANHIHASVGSSAGCGCN